MGKRTKSGTARELQRLLEDRAAEHRAAWARRHPEIAAGERQLRKHNAELGKRWKHKNEGTPETHEKASHRNQGALARLYKSGAIDSEQLASAAEIAAVAERIAADVAVKTASLETRVDRGPRGFDALHDERIGRVRREMAYTRWRAQLRTPAPVLDMVVDDCGIAAAAVRHRLHVRKVRRLLLEALDLWPEILGEVCRAIDDKDLDAAHKRLAA